MSGNTKKSLDRVEMRPAYDWTCPECGRDSFVRAIAAEVTPEHCENLGVEGEEAEELMSGRWQTYPHNVVCQHCDTMFPTMAVGQEEDEEEFEREYDGRGEGQGEGDDEKGSEDADL